MDIGRLRRKATDWIGKYKFVILILLVGVGLMLIPTGSKEKTPDESVTEQVEQQVMLADELEEILTNIQGAGRVQVMLTMRAGEQTIYQTDTPSTDRQDTVIVTDEDRAQGGLIQQILAPTYRGAIVLCQGADSASVCLAIKDAVSKVTGLDSSQISVLKMK
jgi:stage III sporulation protein AG